MCIRDSQKIGKAVSDEEIVHALNELLIGIPLDRLTLLRKLRQRFNVMTVSYTHLDVYKRQANVLTPLIQKFAPSAPGSPVF